MNIKKDKRALAITSSAPDVEAEEEQEEGGRETWRSPLQFFFYCLSYAIGFGNMWRFPYLCYRNGGAAFLIPYAVMLILAGIPVFFLELFIGQYSSMGPVILFPKLAPILSGLGWGVVTIAFITAIYFNVILAWAFFYLVYSFFPVLPWSHCGNDFNSPQCYPEEGAALCRNESRFYYNQSCLLLNDYCGLANLLPLNQTHCRDADNTTIKSVDKVVARTSASEDFFRNRLLQISDSSWEDMGNMQWEMVGFLALTWVIVGACLARGIKVTGNIVYFTALFPYAVMIILFIRGITLDGAYEGLEYYILKPNVTRLTEIEVWSDAAVQIFYSIGICFGCLVTLSSYNKFTNNCMRDAFMIAIANCSTSVFIGMVIFCVLGFLANEMGVEISEVATSGSGLAFVVYPAAVSIMPIPQLWSVLFFVMLLTIGFGSQFTMVETVITAIVDQFESLRKAKGMVVMWTCIFLFLLGLPMCLQGGIYMFELLFFYSVGVSVFILCLLQVVAVLCFFGFRNVLQGLEEMKIRVPFVLKVYWGATWHLIMPVSVVLIMVLTLMNIVPAYLGDYVFPDNIQLLGWLITCFSIAWIPLGVVFAIATNKKDFWALLKATPDFCPASRRNPPKKEIVDTFRYTYHNDMFTMETLSSP